MKRATPLVLALAAVLMAGCEPAPSTPLAPDHKMPDASKMSAEQVDKLIGQNRDAAQRHP